MATAKPPLTAPPLTAPPRRRWRKVLFVLAVIAVALLAWFREPIAGYARTGAAVGARVGCACRFVEGRALDQCRRDFEPGMALVMLSEDSAAKSVTARFLPLSSASASYRSGQGCVLEPWQD